MVREGQIFDALAGKPVFGIGYSVTAYEPGAVVAAGSAADTITVDAGHGFAANDKGIVGTDLTRYFQIGSVTSTELTLAGGQLLSVAQGEILVNLGTDTGFTEPNYDGSGAVVYTDMDYGNVAVYSTVSANDLGRYIYYHQGIAIWELVKDELGAPFAIVQDVSASSGGEDQVAYQVYYPHLFPSGIGHLGTDADPYPGASIQEAHDAWVADGKLGKIQMVAGVFDLGTTGLDFDIDGSYTTGFHLEGHGGGNEFTAANTDDGATVLRYSGTGEAIRTGSFSTANSQWLENSILKGFKIQQTGTAGTGIGILARLFRWGLFEDINFVDLAVGLALASVSDFNRLTRLRSHDCREYGIYIGRIIDAAGNSLGGTGGQCNGNRLSHCDIKNSVDGLGYTNWGIFITNNCVLTSIYDSEFHNFDTLNATPYGAIRVDDASTNSSNVKVDSCYFESNKASIYVNNPLGTGQDNSGLVVTNCYFQAIKAYGVWINHGGAGDGTYGVSIVGNVFNIPTSAAPYTTVVGIQLGPYVHSVSCHSNAFTIATIAGTFGGGNVYHASLGAITQDHFFLGTERITGAVAFDSTLVVTGASTLTGAATLTGGVVGGIPRNAGTWPINSATAGTDTACSNGTAYVGSVFLGANVTVTGVQYLVGSVGGTNSVVVSLHDKTGALLANSALAGTTVGTAAQLQQVAFTATYAAVGPAWYFVAVTFNGTTAKFRTIPAYCNAGNGVIGNGVTQTFGTAATFTAPTTFTADKVPVASLY